jgi:hypothetical protein
LVYKETQFGQWTKKKKKKTKDNIKFSGLQLQLISLFFIMQIFIALSFFICFETMTAILIPNEVRLFSVFNLFLFVTSHSLTIKKLYKKYLQARKTHTCIYYLPLFMQWKLQSKLARSKLQKSALSLLYLCQSVKFDSLSYNYYFK